MERLKNPGIDFIKNISAGQWAPATFKAASQYTERYSKCI